MVGWWYTQSGIGRHIRREVYLPWWYREAYREVPYHGGTGRHIERYSPVYTTLHT